MTDDLADEIDLALSGAADDDDTARQRAARGKLWLAAPARNSPEIELRAAKLQDIAPIDMQFGDETDAEKIAADPETAREQSDIGRLYDFHISLARSLGEGATWASYTALCKAERVEPMPRYGGQPS